MAKGQVKYKQIKIDKSQFENLCKMQCTETEIMGWFGVCKDTLISWCKATYGVDFSTIYEQKKQGGKIALRRYQLQQAEKNPTMAIWLGKQYLDQRDKIETNNYNINNQISNIADLINNPAPNRNEEDV